MIDFYLSVEPKWLSSNFCRDCERNFMYFGIINNCISPEQVKIGCQTLTLQSILCAKPELFTIKLFQNIVTNDLKQSFQFFTMSVPVDGYSRNVSCLLNWISMFLLLFCFPDFKMADREKYIWLDTSRNCRSFCKYCIPDSVMFLYLSGITQTFS